MCEWGNTRKVMVKVPSNLSYIGKARWESASVDSCIADLVGEMQKGELVTVASCCGHNKYPGVISLDDGRHLLVVADGQISEFLHSTLWRFYLSLAVVHFLYHYLEKVRWIIYRFKTRKCLIP